VDKHLQTQSLRDLEISEKVASIGKAVSSSAKSLTQVHASVTKTVDRLAMAAGHGPVSPLVLTPRPAANKSKRQREEGSEVEGTRKSTKSSAAHDGGIEYGMNAEEIAADNMAVGVATDAAELAAAAQAAQFMASLPTPVAAASSLAGAGAGTVAGSNGEASGSGAQ